LFRPRERAFKQFKCPRPQCVKWDNLNIFFIVNIICCLLSNRNCSFFRFKMLYEGRVLKEHKKQTLISSFIRMDAISERNNSRAIIYQCDFTLPHLRSESITCCSAGGMWVRNISHSNTWIKCVCCCKQRLSFKFWINAISTAKRIASNKCI